jgi:hypothetical protein
MDRKVEPVVVVESGSTPSQDCPWIHHYVYRDLRQTARWFLYFLIVLVALTASRFQTEFFTNPTAATQHNATAGNQTATAASIHLTRFLLQVAGNDSSSSTGAADSSTGRPDSSSTGVGPQEPLTPGTGGLWGIPANSAQIGDVSSNVNVPSNYFARMWAYEAALFLAMIGAALALEIIFTGTFTADLAAFTLLVGAILIGYSANYYDLGLLINNGITRSQIAFAFIAGALAILFGAYLLRLRHTQKPIEDHHPARHALALASLVLWGVALGLACEMMARYFRSANVHASNSDFNVVSIWALTATIFAAAANIAVALSILATGTYTRAFAVFAAIEGIIALAYASEHHSYGPTQGSFSSINLAWEALTIIAGAFSVIAAIFLLATAEAIERDIERKKHHLGLSILTLLLHITLFGLVAALFHKYFWNSSDDHFNIVSAFAWPIGLFASAVAIAAVVEYLVAGEVGGIIALTLTTGLLLLGFAAEMIRYVAVWGPGLSSVARGWEGVAICAAVFSILWALTHLLGRAPSYVAPAQHHDQSRGLVPSQPTEAEFANRGGQPVAQPAAEYPPASR